MSPELAIVRSRAEAQRGPTVTEFSVVCELWLSCEPLTSKQQHVRKITYRKYILTEQRKGKPGMAAWGSVACVGDCLNMLLRGGFNEDSSAERWYCSALQRTMAGTLQPFLLCLPKKITWKHNIHF